MNFLKRQVLFSHPAVIHFDCKKQRLMFLAIKTGDGCLVSLPQSDEVYLLQKYRWLILFSQSNIKYHSDPRMDSHFRYLMNTFDYKDALFRIDPNLKDFRDLKETYIHFNSRNAGKPLEAQKELDELIPMYQNSEHEIFRDFGNLLEKYRDYIINSFIMVEKHDYGKVYESRLSNGP